MPSWQVFTHPTDREAVQAALVAQGLGAPAYQLSFGSVEAEVRNGSTWSRMVLEIGCAAERDCRRDERGVAYEEASKAVTGESVSVF